MKRALLTLFLAFSNTLVQAAQISCSFDIDDTRPVLSIQPDNDIYTSSKIDLPNGYRFSGQYLSELNKFKAYVFHTPKDRHVLLTLQTFDVSTSSCHQDFGQHRVYDSADERELYFHCRKTC